MYAPFWFQKLVDEARESKSDRLRKESRSMLSL